MKIGDYVRTKSYGIKKINGFISTLEEDFIDCNYNKYTRCLINKKDIIKSSPNIIDLIEVGDYVNEMTVHCVYADRDEIVVGGLDILIQDTLVILKSNSIKSIVTHEQIESMEYKIGE